MEEFPHLLVQNCNFQVDPDSVAAGIACITMDDNSDDFRVRGVVELLWDKGENFYIVRVCGHVFGFVPPFATVRLDSDKVDPQPVYMANGECEWDVSQNNLRIKVRRWSWIRRLWRRWRGRRSELIVTGSLRGIAVPGPGLYEAAFRYSGGRVQMEGMDVRAWHRLHTNP